MNAYWKGKNRFVSNKFGAIKQTYNGYSYDSKLEAQYAAQLDWLVKAGEVKEWERQVKLALSVNDNHICNYFVDFLVRFSDGREEYHEVKGYETPEWKLKWKLAKAIYSENNFILIK